MAKTTRQTAIFGVEDWKRFYQTFREADFQSYDFETLRKSFVDYLRLYYPETFNDYVESSEFIALLDVIAFMGQALAFRTDLNARENFIDSAERRDSVVRLANLVGYSPKRNTAGQGLLKVFSVTTTENVQDFNGLNLSNVIIDWNDPTNPSWLEQFTTIVNASLVSSQRYGQPGNSQDILGVRTDEYTINLVPGYLPVVPYTTTVDGISMPFEVVSSTSTGRDYVYEPAPRPSGAFSMLYRSDGLGFGSDDTGFFFLFKQGVLQNQDFNLGEAIPNRTVNVNIEGCNQEDHWLFKVDDAGGISGQWMFEPNIYAAAAEQLNPESRAVYSITSRANDQITLTFGDGVFAEIPVGLFRAYVRASNGLEYVIDPQEMQNITVAVSYISRYNRLETITFNCGLTAPVSNARPRETLDEIKQRAPARYYTQNRMVNGEDYNNFPFTQYSSIIRSKAVARSSIGTSRYTDLVDITTKYSSTNIYASDGVFYRENSLPTFNFAWFNVNDIADVINNSIEPLLTSRAMLQFYYANFPRPSLTSPDLGLVWNQSTTQVNETTGYFYAGTPEDPQVIGSYSSTNARFLAQGCLLRFVPPTGYYFTANNRLAAGVPTLATDRTEVWATINNVVLDGTNQGNGNLDNGLGPVTINDFVPSTALPQEVIPRFVGDLTPTFESSMLQEIQLFRDFGIGYDNLTATWYLITVNNLDRDGEFSLQYAQNTSGQNLDASWLLQFVTDGRSYTVTSRALNYIFSSVIETRFFFDTDYRVYDNKTGSIIRDFIDVLKVNSRPDSNEPLANNVIMDIIGQPVQPDGYVNDYEVLVSFRDSDNDGVADDPDFFDELVAPAVNPNTKLVFLQQTIDFDDLERWLPVEPGVVNATYPDLDAIELVKTEYVNGQVFYAYTSRRFYQLEVYTVSGTVQRRLTEIFTFQSRVGRQSLAFQYRHNSPLTNVIDPGTTNIIDVYLVTSEYYTAYQNYVRDTTGTVPEPSPPTLNQLNTAYQGLNDYRMVSDNMVLNSVRFKPLFGAKAAPALQATIKVVRAPRITTSVSEIKSLVIARINDYFTIDKWNFGDSFFFSELSAYLHEQLGSILSSVVLVPLDPLKSFGDLYEIRSAPNEIFVSAATVDDVEVITALTQSNIRSQTPVAGLYPNSMGDA